MSYLNITQILGIYGDLIPNRYDVQNPLEWDIFQTLHWETTLRRHVPMLDDVSSQIISENERPRITLW